MIRYRTLKVDFKSESQAVNFLHSVEDSCKTDMFRFGTDELRLYDHNDKVSQILSNVPCTQEAVIILAVNNSCFYVANIIPLRHTSTRISKERYNCILETFYETIIAPMVNQDDVDFPEAKYDMQSLIPNSYNQLRHWATACPSSPFLHQLDLEKWFEFLCMMRDNNESLSAGDLELWLTEELKWSDDLVEETILHYEHDTDLLRYSSERNS